jgi:dolichyl-phosphate beta-glucosyltransferase
MELIAEHLERHPHWLPAEIVVVDDGSVDGTAAAALKVAMPRQITVELVVHDRNLGKGAAVRTGFERCVGEFALLCDADLAAPIDELEVLRDASGPDRVVIGSRALDRELIWVRQPGYRDFMGRSFNLAVRLLVMPGIHDTQCGFKLFPGQLARALAAVQRIDGFAFDVELLVLARHWGAELHELAVRWHHVEASRVRPIRHSSEMLRDLMLLWLRCLRGRLPPPPGGVQSRMSASEG